MADTIMSKYISPLGSDFKEIFSLLLINKSSKLTEPLNVPNAQWPVHSKL